MSNNLAKKKYIVTGASSGIGNAVTQRLASTRCEVLAYAGRSESAEENLVHPNISVFRCDFSDLKSIETLFSSVGTDYSSIDGVILCHGYGMFGSLEEFSAKNILDLVNINLISNILICRKLLPVLKMKKSGDVILMGSEAGLKGGKKGAVYCATKFGVNGLAQSLREECSASGVRVSVVNPGMVNTPFFDDLDFQPGESRDNYVEAEDVANMVLTMLSMPSGSVVDQISISPQKNVIRNKSR